DSSRPTAAKERRHVRARRLGRKTERLGRCNGAAWGRIPGGPRLRSDRWSRTDPHRTACGVLDREVGRPPARASYQAVSGMRLAGSMLFDAGASLFAGVKWPTGILS